MSKKTKKTWNHRVIRHKFEKEERLAIHEVHYDDDVPSLVTTEAVSLWADDLDGMRTVVGWVSACLDKPILDYSDFEPGGKYGLKED